MQALLKSPFFKGKLDSVWKGKTVIDIEFPSQRLLEAFLLSVQKLVSLKTNHMCLL